MINAASQTLVRLTGLTHVAIARNLILKDTLQHRTRRSQSRTSDCVQHREAQALDRSNDFDRALDDECEAIAERQSSCTEEVV
jgi:hypothetical protein